MGSANLADLEIRESVCSELEALVGLQKCIILRQEGLNLYAGRKAGKMIYIPLKDSSAYTQTIISKKIVVVNEAPKDRSTVNEVRNSLNLSQKV